MERLPSNRLKNIVSDLANSMAKGIDSDAPLAKASGTLMKIGFISGAVATFAFVATRGDGGQMLGPVAGVAMAAGCLGLLKVGLDATRSEREERKDTFVAEVHPPQNPDGKRTDVSKAWTTYKNLGHQETPSYGRRF